MPLGLPGSPSALLSSSQGGNVGSNDDCFSDPCFVPGAVIVRILFHVHSTPLCLTLPQVRKINAPQFAQPCSPLKWRVPQASSPLDHTLSQDTNTHVGSLLVCSALSILSLQGLWSPYTRSSPETQPGP